MKPFDERFSEKVREVFDRHDEPFDPAAWVSMQARLRAKRKARVIALLSVASKAAAVLLLLGGMTWLTMVTFLPGKPDMAEKMLTDDTPAISGLSDLQTDQDDDRPVADETVVPGYLDEAVSPATLAESSSSEAPSAGKSFAEGSEDLVVPVDDTVAGMLTAKEADDRVSPVDETVAGVLLAEEPDERVSPTGKTGAGVDTMTGISDSLYMAGPAHGASDGASEHAVILAEQEKPDVVLTDPAAMAQVESTVTSDTLSLVGITTDPSYEYMKPDISQGRDVLSGQPVNGMGASSVGRLHWSVMAGSMLTYAEQQLASGLGFSGGVMSEYRASSLFSVSSGLALAYQQFEVDGMPLRQRLSRAEYDYLPDNFSARTVGNQSYELLALDIPVNVQYYFSEVTRSQWYVSAGFSSLLYLQQRVSGTEIAYIEADYYDAALGSNRTMNYASEVQTESNYDAFTRFDFARLLNLSVGYEIKQEKSTAIIEPYIKYPLGTLSSRNIKMGMGGVRLRLRFGH